MNMAEALLRTTRIFQKSPDIFIKQDGTPVKFYSDAFYEDLKYIIESGGGVLCEEKTDSCIQLCEHIKDPRVKTQGFLPMEYIKDCVMRKTCLDVDRYREDYLHLPRPATKDSLGESDNMYKGFYFGPLEPNKSSGKRRIKYSTADDLRILGYLITHERCKETGGNMVWQDMARVKVTGHTYQSMKDRYRKVILPSIDQYNISEKWKAILRGSANQWGDKAHTRQDVGGQPELLASTEDDMSSEVDFMDSAESESPSDTENQGRDPNSGTSSQRLNETTSHQKKVPLQFKTKVSEKGLFKEVDDCVSWQSKARGKADSQFFPKAVRAKESSRPSPNTGNKAWNAPTDFRVPGECKGEHNVSNNGSKSARPSSPSVLVQGVNQSRNSMRAKDMDKATGAGRSARRLKRQHTDLEPLGQSGVDLDTEGALQQEDSDLDDLDLVVLAQASQEEHKKARTRKMANLLGCVKHLQCKYGVNFLEAAYLLKMCDCNMSKVCQYMESPDEDTLTNIPISNPS